ncbi:MAG: hypothetical protein ACR2PT_24445 [Endozoicomonas sp.]
MNTLVDSWGGTGGLHIIPAQTYSLNRPVRLTSTQALLPIATSDNGDPLIHLNVVESYSHGSGPFALLQLTQQSRVGGVSINASSFPSSLNTGDNSSLAVIEDSAGDIELAGSVLQGSNLTQLLRLESNASDNRILLQRNMFLCGDVCIQSSLGQKQRLIMTNNLVDSEGFDGKGIVISGGNHELVFNDFSCPDCKAIEVNDSTSFVISSNAFWGVFSTAVFFKKYPSQQGELSFNSHKDGINLVEFDDSIAVRFIKHDNFANIPSGAYPWKLPARFFSYTGKGGAVSVAVGALQDLDDYIVGNNVSEIQQLIPFRCNNCSSVHSLTAIRQKRTSHFPECSSQQSGYTFPGAIAQAILMFGVMPVVSVVNCIVSYRLGRKDLIKYQQLQNIE